VGCDLDAKDRLLGLAVAADRAAVVPSLNYA
jgi:hypothetical protein